MLAISAARPVIIVRSLGALPNQIKLIIVFIFDEIIVAQSVNEFVVRHSNHGPGPCRCHSAITFVRPQKGHHHLHYHPTHRRRCVAFSPASPVKRVPYNWIWFGSGWQCAPRYIFCCWQMAKRVFPFHFRRTYRKRWEGGGGSAASEKESHLPLTTIVRAQSWCGAECVHWFKKICQGMGLCGSGVFWLSQIMGEGCCFEIRKIDWIWWAPIYTL